MYSSNEWKEIKFWWQKNKKSDFYKNKKVIKIDGIDINNILVSKEESCGPKNSLTGLVLIFLKKTT